MSNTKPVLYIANKNYSSWSFRPWIALVTLEIDFEERLQTFGETGQNAHFKTFSPTAKVPVLVDNGCTIWESLAILEYLADKHPDKGFWPSDRQLRARARSVAHEMHAGFMALRAECPMNIRRSPSSITGLDTSRQEALHRDVQRIEQLWTECLQASGGPFLFGSFSNADAMYAPVVNRFEVYQLSTQDDALRYRSSMKALPSWQAWETASRAEPWIVDEDEV